MDFKRLTIFALTTMALVATVGCSNNAHVSGRVAFENGQPLSIGQIIFTDDFYMAKSDIDKNGEYSLHSLRRNDGIRKGTYRVYITGALGFQETEATHDRLQDYRMDGVVQLIDMQHTNPDTSGWLFDIKKSQRIDLVVYPPNEVPEDKRTEAAKMMFDPEYRKKMQKEMAEARDAPPELPKKHRTVNPNLL